MIALTAMISSHKYIVLDYFLHCLGKVLQNKYFSIRDRLPVTRSKFCQAAQENVLYINSSYCNKMRLDNLYTVD